MPAIELKCRTDYKNKVLDHLSKMGSRYKSQSHFLIEAIEDRISKDKQTLAYDGPADENGNPI